MVDLPEVRQILRDNDLFTARSQRLNRRGQLPSQLRHSIKAEDSGEDTEDDAQYEIQAKVLEGLIIEGEAVTAGEEMNKSQAEQVEELIAGKKDALKMNDPSDKYRLLYNKELTRKQKLAHYATPDYCIITRADTVNVLRLSLDGLVSRGGIYYSVFDLVNEEADFAKTER